MSDIGRLWKRLHRNLSLSVDPTISPFNRKRRARNAAACAEKLGIILRKDACESCGSRDPLERHHPDYSTPLRIVWLCEACHRIADAACIDTDGGRAA